MKKLSFFAILLCVVVSSIKSQNYTSYFTGSVDDVSPATNYGICLMGGAGEHDEAMKRFLQASGGGDIVVIRVTGTNGYNNYLYSGLGVTVNSVETLVIPSITAANDSYVETQLRNAEAIWIAGGDQYDYLSLWKGTAVENAINDHVNIKHSPIGGLSAGMAILGNTFYTAQNGSVTSAEALANPYNSKMTFNNDFLTLPFLENTITDTHYNNPIRKGRHFTFLARLTQDFGQRFFGIACNEYVAVYIDQNKIAYVYGDPTKDDFAYFLQTNCVEPFMPETCVAANSLTWNRNNAAVKVYKVLGSNSGNNSFNLNDWKTGNGGIWENWYAESGIFSNINSIAPDCSSSIEESNISEDIKIYPIPTSNFINIDFANEQNSNTQIILCDLFGIEKYSFIYNQNNKYNIENIESGIYFFKIITENKIIVKKIVIQK